MKIKSIDVLAEIGDIFDTNVDVAVTLENGYTYTVVVGTQKIY